MEIFSGIEILKNYPALFIKDIKAVIIADLHLGYEGILAEQGVYIPKIQFKKELELMQRIVSYIKNESKDVDKIIICGDIKHEFSETTYHEFAEVSEMFNYLKSNFERVILIKGNHDNFIYRITNKHGVELHDSFAISKYYFLHGHKIFEALSEVKSRFIIFGHEHPAIAVYDEIGSKEKLKCFLYGHEKEIDKSVIVLPAFSYLAQGSEVNIIPESELLSPLFEKININSLKALCISEEAGVLDFGTVEKLRYV